MAGPLDGVKIADFTEIIAGPLAGRLLAEMGADVIKIEPPWGEPWRLNQRFTATESRGFMVYNRGKRSLPLDLTKPESQEILGRLIPQVDVVLANFRPDVAAKLGVDYPTLDSLNPRLVYCEVTAHGRAGPEADRPGYDMILQAMSGLMACETKLDNGVPQQIWSTPLIDTTAGFCLAWCVCGALFAREQTGKGQKVETSLLGSALALMGARFLNVEDLDRETRHKALQDLEEKRASSASYQELLDASPGSRRQRHHANVYYRVYLTKDSPISVGCLSDPLRRRLLDTLGLTDIGLEPGYNPNTPEALAYAKDLEGQAEKILIKNTSAYWLELFENRGIPAGPVRFVEELFDDPQIQANGLVNEAEHRDAGKVKMMGPLAMFSGTPMAPEISSPALGEHTWEILEELGYSGDEISRYRDSGATV
ncbi:MAG: CoA transferase [Dehalococcoidia bacterium]|jgi:formyl-CoA transferase|nr:CoA transferase [Dehalococcoidia bacterium]MEE2926467.1 CoA transferase [Chloroflexota bacterium]HIB11037.1 CoA transferase [Dehalococcoidia bacterium]|tara:strand:+ start:1033 stop:2304 length:1272 start_codon:yes stop_codon:yes gene_type:complete